MKLKQLLARSFLYNLFNEARFSHAKKYLIKALLHQPDPYETFVLSKDKTRSVNIWALKQVKHRIQHFSDDLYIWNLGKEEWLGNITHIHGLYEYLTGSFNEIYTCDYQDKVVLDIGGYIGDSARYFLSKGAQQVVIYEPVKKNLTCMQHNLKEHLSKVTVIPKGVSARSESITIGSSYPEGHIGFGCKGNKYQLTVEADSFDSILNGGHFDIAKIDCEGNEKYLLDVESEQLKKIPHWMVEIHESALVEKLHEKFHSCGFSVHEVPVPLGHLGVYHYRLCNQS